MYFVTFDQLDVPLLNGNTSKIINLFKGQDSKLLICKDAMIHSLQYIRTPLFLLSSLRKCILGQSPFRSLVKAVFMSCDF